MKLIVAVNNKNFIGRDNLLMWHSKADLKHFKRMTEGCKLLVGANTFSTLPYLPNREMLVVGKKYLSMKDALAGNPDWVIGGASIYKQLAHLCDEIHISYIDDDQDGDTKFFIPEDYKGVVHEYDFSPDLQLHGDKYVKSANTLRSRGSCCGSICDLCPYEPKHTRGSRNVIDFEKCQS